MRVLDIQIITPKKVFLRRDYLEHVLKLLQKNSQSLRMRAFFVTDYKVKLLQFNFSASGFQFSFDSFSFFFRSAFFNSFRSAVYQIFSFFQAQVCNSADFFNNVNFVSACFSQNYIKFCLFFSSGSACTISLSFKL